MFVVLAPPLGTLLAVVLDPTMEEEEQKEEEDAVAVAVELRVPAAALTPTDDDFIPDGAAPAPEGVEIRPPDDPSATAAN